MSYQPSTVPVHLSLLVAGLLAGIGGLSLPFTLAMAGLTLAYSSFYSGLELAAVTASAIALPIASAVCTGVSGIAFTRIVASKSATATAAMLVIAAGALPAAFACWHAVAFWVGNGS